jgi:hypothetical protein
MTDAYFAAFAAGEPEAVAAMIDFYGGRGTFAAWPPRLRAYAVATMPVNILDWTCAYGFLLSRPFLGLVKAPTLVAWGGASHPAAQRANDLVAAWIKGAARTIVAGATHFMIATHAAEVAALVGRHVARAEA